MEYTLEYGVVMETVFTILTLFVVVVLCWFSNAVLNIFRRRAERRRGDQAHILFWIEKFPDSDIAPPDVPKKVWQSLNASIINFTLNEDRAYYVVWYFGDFPALETRHTRLFYEARFANIEQAKHYVSEALFRVANHLVARNAIYNTYGKTPLKISNKNFHSATRTIGTIHL